MEGHQLRTGDAQVILGIHNHGFLQQAGVKRDFVKALEQQRVGNQRQIRMEAKGRDSAENAGGQGIDFGRAGEEAFSPPKWLASWLRSACRSAARIARTCFLRRFPSPCRPGLCALPQIGSANFTYRFTFPDRLVLHDAKTRALLGE
jgi:hypothetical protein